MLIKDGVDAEEAEEATKQLIKSRLSVHPDDPRAIGCWSMAEEFQKAELFSGMRSSRCCSARWHCWLHRTSC